MDDQTSGTTLYTAPIQRLSWPFQMEFKYSPCNNLQPLTVEKSATCTCTTRSFDNRCPKIIQNAQEQGLREIKFHECKLSRSVFVTFARDTYIHQSRTQVHNAYDGHFTIVKIVHIFSYLLEFMTKHDGKD